MECTDKNEFFNLYRHGFVRAAVCIPAVKVADVRFNTDQTIHLAREAAAGHVLLAVFPSWASRPIPMKTFFIRRRC